MPEYNMKDVTEHIIVCKPAAPKHHYVLRECPFCGDDVRFEPWPNRSIVCLRCDIEIKNYMVYMTQDDLVAKWNKRVKQ